MRAIAATILDAPTSALIATSGILLGLAYPPNPAGFAFAGIGLVPLLILVERSPGWRTDVWQSYLAFLIFSALSTWWVGSWQTNSDPWLAISSILLVIIHPLFFCVPVVLYGIVRRRFELGPSLAFFALLFCGGEWLHSLGEASYPWLTLGNTFTYNYYYLQVIQITGVWGLSLMALIQNSVIAWWILRQQTATEEIQRRLAVRTLAIIGATTIPVYIAGFVLVNLPAFDYGRSIDITIVQPNQNPWDKWRKDDTVDHILDNAGLTLDAIRDEATPTAVLWAENAIPYPMTNPNFGAQADLMRQMVDEIGVPVITGFPDYVEHPSKEAARPSSKKLRRSHPQTGQPDTLYYDHYNSIGVFAPGTGIGDIYHKSQLVPFGERVPYIDVAPFLAELLSWDVGISSWGVGRGPHAIDLPLGNDTIPFAGMVCFESVYPNMVREFVDDGAQFLTIVTNDGWYLHTPGPLQHQRFAILRAVETRRAIARAANTGISCAIAPDGTIVAETKEGERTTITATIALRTDRTFYVRYGDWLPVGALIGAFGVVLWGFVRRRRLEENPGGDVTTQS